jgi:hypothetical protein
MIKEHVRLVSTDGEIDLKSSLQIQERQSIKLPETWFEWYEPNQFLAYIPRTEAKQLAMYLTYLEETGVPSTAYRAVPIAYWIVKRWRDTIDVMADLEQEALEGFKGKLHAEMIRRAVDGHKEPVFYQGEVSGYIVRRSDRILELMARGHMPEKFGDRIAVTQTIQSGVLALPAGLTAEEWVAQHSPKPLAAPSPVSPIDRSQAEDVEMVNEDVSSESQD